MKTEIMVHCGNAPKMGRVIDLTVALAQQDEAAAKTHAREDFMWNQVGSEEAVAYGNLGAVLAKRPAVSCLSISNALSHGNAAMCEGEMVLADGSAFYFCNVARFASTAKDALVKQVHTYMVPKP